MRHSLIEERTTHKQRIHAQLFHNGYPQQSNLDSIEGRARLEGMELPAAARKVVNLSLAMIDHINEELAPIEAQLKAYALAPRLAVRRSWSTTALGSLPAWRCFRSSATLGSFRARRRQCVTPGWTSPSTAPTTNGQQVSSEQAGSAGIEMGSIRGGQKGLEKSLARSRVLPTEQGTHRGQSGGSIHCAQVDPASTPHLRRAGRGGHQRASAPS